MEEAEKISVTLTPEMLRWVRESVEAGEFASTNDAIREAVRLWHREKTERAHRLETIREKLARSVNDPRPPLSLEEAFGRIDAIHEASLRARGDEAA